MPKIRFPKKDKAQQSRAKREQAPKVYDSRAAIPANAKVFVDVIDAPLAIPDAPTMQPAMRRDGSITPRGDELRAPTVPREKVIKSLRGDPLLWMKARGQVSELQFAAGEALRRAWALAEIGSVKAIDFTVEKVDGGYQKDAISESQRKGLQFIAVAKEDLGPEGWALSVDILRDGMSVRDAAAKRGQFKQGQVEYLGSRFRECLDTLMVTFGMANRRQIPTIFE